MMVFDYYFNFENDYYSDDTTVECPDYNIKSIEMLSPPISITSHSKANALLSAYNDSDMRESNFLRRMQQQTLTKKETICSCEFTIIPVAVKTKATTQPALSSVKVKLESVPKADKTLTMRANSRRAMKYQKQHGQLEEFVNFHNFTTEQIEEDLLVW